MGFFGVIVCTQNAHNSKHYCKYNRLHADGVSASASEIEFNLTGSYGSPIHTNHNSNYSSMPSPDMDQSDRKQQHDQSRRPLSVATDNMMLEFYKKDGYDAKCSLLLPTSHSPSVSLFPPTPLLRQQILNSYIWGEQRLHIKILRYKVFIRMSQKPS